MPDRQCVNIFHCQNVSWDREQLKNGGLTSDTKAYGRVRSNAANTYSEHLQVDEPKLRISHSLI